MTKEGWIKPGRFEEGNAAAEQWTAVPLKMTEPPVFRLEQEEAENDAKRSSPRTARRFQEILALPQDYRNTLYKIIDIMAEKNQLADLCLEDLSEFRLFFDPFCAYFAANRFTDADEANFAAYFDKLFYTNPNEDERIRLDREFHLTIAKASKNPFMIFIMQKINKEGFDALLHHQIYDKISPEVTASEHKKIYNAIKERKPDTAIEYSIEHFKRGTEYYHNINHKQEEAALFKKVLDSFFLKVKSA